MLKALAQVAACAIASFIVVSWMEPTRPVKDYYSLMVVTFDGNVFEAGAGRTCHHAWEGAVIPDDWKEINCYPAR